MQTDSAPRRMKISRYFRGKWTRARFHVQNTSRRGAVGLAAQRLQVDDQLEGRRPFYRQVGRFGTLQEAVDIGGRALPQGRPLRPLGHEAFLPYKCRVIRMGPFISS